jgi:uncharacterized protein (DUF983 family)
MDSVRRVMPAGRGDWLSAIRRGFGGRCPSCGTGRMFGRYLKVVDSCAECGTDLHHHRADDLPPYLVILLVGHVVIWGVLTAELKLDVPLWMHLAVWPLMGLVLSLLLLQPVKGAVVGLQYALGMHGFGTSPGHPRHGE